jgi:hypothetical protein
MGDGPFLLHPRFGFSEQQMINEILANASLASTLQVRAAGTRFAVAIGVFTLSAGVGTVRMFVEGTLDGTNWFVLAQTSGATDLSASGQVVLNASGSSLVDLQRFQSIRTRAAIVAGAPTFELQTIVTAISRDAEEFVRSEVFSRAGAVPTTQFGDNIVRPAGTMLVNLQVVASGVVLDGATSFDVVLQGSPDSGTTWVTIGTAAVTANGSSLMLVDTETLFSLGEYSTLRMGVVDNGAAGAASAFTITSYLGLDSSDWIDDADDGTGGGGSFDPNDVFCIVTFGAPTAEVLNTRTISLQISDYDGNPIASARKIELIVYDTSNAGDVDLANNATFSLVNTGTAIAGLATNRLVLLTNASGAANVSVLDAAVETTYLTAVNNQGPSTLPQIIVQAAEVPLSYI